MAIEVSTLKEMYKSAHLQKLDAERAIAEYNYVAQSYNRENRVPPGYDLDLFGDCTIKPSESCKKLPGPDFFK